MQQTEPQTRGTKVKLIVVFITLIRVTSLLFPTSVDKWMKAEQGVIIKEMMVLMVLCFSSSASSNESLPSC